MCKAIAVLSLFCERDAFGANCAETATPTVGTLATTAPLTAPAVLPENRPPPAKPAIVFTAALAPISCPLDRLEAIKSPRSLPSV